MNKISVKSGITVEVNDKGETITINTDDQQFIERFYGLIEKLDETKEKVVQERGQGRDVHEQLEFIIDRTREIMDEMDNIFGEGCCRKVFGDIVPNPYLLADFFEQITPVIKQYTQERRKSIAEKYSSNRRGGNRSSRRHKGERVR